MGMKRLLVAAAALPVLVGPVANAQAASVLMSKNEIRQVVAEADEVRRRLYSEVGAQQPDQGDYLNITVFGGMPPPDRFSIYLTPSGAGLRAEIVTRDRVFNGPVKPTRRVVFMLAPKAAQDVEALLATPVLWGDPEGRRASCTDQPEVVLDMRWAGKRRQSARLSLVCTPPDPTHRLIDLVLAQADKR
jgi:hypothetical protein